MLGELVIGDGLIGKNLYYRLRSPIGNQEVGYTSRREGGIRFDLKEFQEIPRASKVYICAGETRTVECERDVKGTREVNVEGTLRLVKKLVKEGSWVLFISSERVFDGSRACRKYTEEVCPTTEYGRQKVEAERGVLEMGGTVIRLAKVLGHEVPLFEGWVKELREGKEIHPASNMSMSPVPVDFASLVIQKIGKERVGGLQQMSGRYDVSYAQIAYHIANYLGFSLNLVQPVEVEAAHPHTTLDYNGLEQRIGVTIPDTWETIYHVVKELNYGCTRFLGRAQ